jgi:5-methylcytosine-specific restriction protein A
MPQLKVRDLPAPITASKADWLAGTTWIGFSPPSGDLQSRNDCSRTIQRQFGKGYIIEYITEQFSQPNPGFEKDPDYIAEREAHGEQAGRFIGVHRLRYSSRPLETILGADGFKKLQDMWAQGGKRWRWSVAFPIVETYRIIGRPKAKEVLGDAGYRRLFAHSSATLRPLNDAERASLADLDLEPVVAKNAWIAIEDEFQNAEAYPLTLYGVRDMRRDLPDGALEGMTDERRARVRKRAAWLADRFVILRSKAGRLHCDDCKFDPSTVFPSGAIKPRSLLDVHHKHPMEEGVRYTTVNDFALLCPTCHRIEHGRMKIAARDGV